MNIRVPIVIFDRHIHLSRHDAEILFGKGFTLTKYQLLSQPGQFVAQETLTVKWAHGSLENVQIFWPWRKYSQVEILTGDLDLLWVDAPTRVSADLSGSGTITLIGPQGELVLQEGVIVPQRHLHLTVADAEEFWLQDGQSVAVKTSTEKSCYTFDSIVVRVRDDYVLDCHITLEEWKLAWLGVGAWWTLML